MYPYKWYKNRRLSFSQKLTYEAILKGLMMVEKSIRVYDTCIESLNTIIATIMDDVPNLFYVNSFKY